MLAAIRDNDTDALAAILAGLPPLDPAFEIGCRPSGALGSDLVLPPLSCELYALDYVVRKAMLAVYGPGIEGLAVCHPFYYAALLGGAATLELVAGWCRPTTPAFDRAIVLTIGNRSGLEGETERVAWFCARIPLVTAIVCNCLYRKTLAGSAVWAALLDSALDDPWRFAPNLRSNVLVQEAPELVALVRRAEARRGSPARWAWIGAVVGAASRR